MGKISAKTERTPVDGTEYFATAAGGNSYKTSAEKVKDYVLTFFANKVALDRIEVYETTFNNASLSSGALAVNHGKNAVACFEYLETPAGVRYTGATASRTDADNISIDFGGAIETGTWKLILICIIVS